MTRDDNRSAVTGALQKFGRTGGSKDALAISEQADDNQRHFKNDKGAVVHTHRDGSRTATRVGKTLAMVDGGGKGSVLVETTYKIIGFAPQGKELPNIGGSVEDSKDKPRQIEAPPSDRSPTMATRRPEPSLAPTSRTHDPSIAPTSRTRNPSIAPSAKTRSTKHHVDWPEDNDALSYAPSRATTRAPFDDEKSMAPSYRTFKPDPTMTSAASSRHPLPDERTLKTKATSRFPLDDEASIAPSRATSRFPLKDGASTIAPSTRARPQLDDGTVVSRAPTSRPDSDGRSLAPSAARSYAPSSKSSVYPLEDAPTVMTAKTGKTGKTGKSSLYPLEDAPTMMTAKTGKTGKSSIYPDQLEDAPTMMTGKTGRSTIKGLPDERTMASTRRGDDKSMAASAMSGSVKSYKGDADTMRSSALSARAPTQAQTLRTSKSLGLLADDATISTRKTSQSRGLLGDEATISTRKTQQSMGLLADEQTLASRKTGKSTSDHSAQNISLYGKGNETMRTKGSRLLDLEDEEGLPDEPSGTLRRSKSSGVLRDDRSMRSGKTGATSKTRGGPDFDLATLQSQRTGKPSALLANGTLRSSASTMNGSRADYDAKSMGTKKTSKTSRTDASGMPLLDNSTMRSSAKSTATEKSGAAYSQHDSSTMKSSATEKSGAGYSRHDGDMMRSSTTEHSRASAHDMQSMKSSRTGTTSSRKASAYDVGSMLSAKSSRTAHSKSSASQYDVASMASGKSGHTARAGDTSTMRSSADTTRSSASRDPSAHSPLGHVDFGRDDSTMRSSRTAGTAKTGKTGKTARDFYGDDDDARFDLASLSGSRAPSKAPTSASRHGDNGGFRGYHTQTSGVIKHPPGTPMG